MVRNSIVPYPVRFQVGRVHNAKVRVAEGDRVPQHYDDHASVLGCCSYPRTNDPFVDIRYGHCSAQFLDCYVRLQVTHELETTWAIYSETMAIPEWSVTVVALLGDR